MHHIISFSALAFVLGAVGRRVCGGAFQQWTGKDIGDTPVRLFFGVCLGAAALIAGVHWYYCLALIPVTWVGTVTGNFNSMAMGRGGMSYAHDFFGLSLHGLLSGILPAAGAYFAGYGYVAIAIAALSISPLYTLGWAMTGIQGKPSWPLGFRSGTEWGELLWGGAMGLGTLVAAVS